jgi:hypothetical protein
MEMVDFSTFLSPIQARVSNIKLQRRKSQAEAHGADAY